MSYQVLARKWRPQHFAQLVGQDHVKNALGNALTSNRLHHAYLFTGTRGVGKTTIARIFAKSLNCEQGVTATPCGQCSACLEIDAGNFVDLLEIDAASRTKVEDTRDLLDNVQYAPSRGRFKVYLIDEVHMLSKHSFNALLKTLEEPPPHVKFLLATTDPQKLPVTVLSRCLQFNLLALSPQQIEQHLAYVLNAEQVPFEPEALVLLARAAKGSLRDSLSLTDQAIAQSNANISFETVRTMLGFLDQSWAQLLLQAVLTQDVAMLQQQLAALVQQQSHYTQVLDDILSLLHLTALTQFSPAAAQFSPQQEYVQALAQQLAPAQVQLYYQLLISGKKELPFAPDPLTGLEMALLRALAFQPQTQSMPVAAATERPALSALIKPPAQVPSVPPAAVSVPASSTAVPVPEDKADITVVNTAPAATPNVMAVTESALVDASPFVPETMSTVQQVHAGGVAPDTMTAPAADAERLDEQPSSGIDPVTARIMARRGMSVTSTAPKKPERQPAPVEPALKTPPYQALPSAQEAPQAKMPPLAPEPTEKLLKAAPPKEVTPPVVDDYDDSDEADSSAQAQMWQQYQQYEQYEQQQYAAPPVQQQPAATPPGGSEQQLTPFDGSINEQNFSVRFAAQVDAWAARVETLDTGGLSRLFLLNADMQREGDTLTLTVASNQQHLDKGNFRAKLQQVLEHSFNQPLNIEITYQAQVQNSPLAIQQKIVEQRLVYVTALLEQDENIQQFQQLFDAQLLSDTIEVS